MNDLGTALRELAREAEPEAPADPAELWRRGRVRTRVRRLAAVGVVAAVALLLGGLGAAGPEPRLISPASSPHAPGIPNRVEDPPGWLPVTPYGHRVGPLSVLARGLRHGQMALFGIDASSGRYRFLDLPDQVPDTPVALSPNGRWIAYWQGSDGHTITGLNTFDTVTGTSSGLSGDADSKLGLEPGPLTWLDDQTVLLEFGQRQQKGSSVVVPERSRVTETFQPEGEGPTVRAIDPNSGVWSRGHDGTLLVPLSEPDPGQGVPVRFIGYDGALNAHGEFRLPPGGYGSVSRSDNYVVAVGYTGSGGQVGLLAGTVDPLGGVTELHDLGDLRVGTLLGWQTEHSVLVTGWRHDPEGQASLFEADVATGTVKRVGDAGDDVDVVLAVATDLLGKPFVAANPPHGVDPRLVRSAAGGTLVIVLVGLLLWWRRRGPA